MIYNRVIPCLLLQNRTLVKTINFNRYSYIGDPLNTCRIFNELEVDEMAILDIQAAKNLQRPDFQFLQELASECFMPLSYGGGISTLEDAKKIFSIGFEKVILNTVTHRNLNVISQIVETYGSQSVIASIDVKKNFLSKYCIYSQGGKKKEKKELGCWIKQLEKKGIGEILLTDIGREGTWKGFDLDLIKMVTDCSSVPVIVHGGAGKKQDVEDAINIGGASAVGLGNMVVFQKKDMGVLINYSKDYTFVDRVKASY